MTLYEHLEYCTTRAAFARMLMQYDPSLIDNATVGKVRAAIIKRQSEVSPGTKLEMPPWDCISFTLEVANDGGRMMACFIQEFAGECELQGMPPDWDNWCHFATEVALLPRPMFEREVFEREIGPYRQRMLAQCAEQSGALH